MTSIDSLIRINERIEAAIREEPSEEIKEAYRRDLEKVQEAIAAKVMEIPMDQPVFTDEQPLNISSIQQVSAEEIGERFKLFLQKKQ